MKMEKTESVAQGEMVCYGDLSHLEMTPGQMERAFRNQASLNCVHDKIIGLEMKLQKLKNKHFNLFKKREALRIEIEEAKGVK